MPIFLEKNLRFLLTELTKKSCLVWVSFCINKDLNTQISLASNCLKQAGNARNRPLLYSGTKKSILSFFLSCKTLKDFYKNFVGCEIFQILLVHKSKQIYVDIFKWTTIMSRHNAAYIFEIFDQLLKVFIRMRAYMVPPYSTRSEERRRKNLLKHFRGFPSWYAINVPP